MAPNSSGAPRPRKTVRGEMKRVGVIPRLMLIAALVALGLGIASWIRPDSVEGVSQAALEEAGEARSGTTSASSGVDPRLVSGLAAGPSGGTASPSAGGPAAAPESGNSTSSPWSSTMMRIGGSFTAAFIVAFLLRSFVRIGLVVAAVVAGGLYLLERTGVIGVDWTMFQSGAEDAAEWVGDRSDEVWAFVKKTVPSGTAAAIGFWSGFRRG